ncbi:MAG: peptidylprolyl isomerase [Planctomycetes bacterium]|nr:peptidylprolyl isomerase [Planctomycetota bacterium]
MRPTIRLAFTIALAVLPVAACGGGPQDDGHDELDPAIAMLDAFAATQNIGPVKAAGGQWRTNLAKPPQAEFTPGTDYFWNLETSEGPIKIKFMPQVAPMHVSSAIYLTRLGFYDGLTFHRNVRGFMAQGGCPRGDGTGNPGYKFAGEFDPDVRHDRRGLLSTANSGPGTDSCQFFLTYGPSPSLNGKYTIYGEIVEGMDTLDKIEAKGTPKDGMKPGKVTIDRATISVAKS